MSELPVLPFLPSERNQTDLSLNCERRQASELILAKEQEAETLTKNQFTQARRVSDRAKRLIRETSDLARSSLRKSVRYTEVIANQRFDEDLTEERRLADLATNLERKAVDEALFAEREVKLEVIDELSKAERINTDRCLQAERAETDVKVRSETQSLSARDEFLAIVSHDLRSPIGAVLCCADMLLDDDSTLERSALKDWLTLIKRNAEQALRLISDLLDIEKINQGKILIFPTPQNLRAVIRESISTFALSASKKSVLLSLAPSDEAFELNFDRDRILQVLGNLIGNALKFTPHGGEISIHAEAREGFARITVKDSGPGIASEHLKKVFERFAQLKSPLLSGLGLGLYIANTLILAHKGALWVESHEGNGSQFIFTLPLMKAPLH